MKQYSLGRPTEEYELGQTAVFLASDESSAITDRLSSLTVACTCGVKRNRCWVRVGRQI